MANSYNITATQGSTLLLSINCKDSVGNYINLSGYNYCSGYVRKSYSDTGILLNLNPTINTSYISGLINISGSADDLAACPVGEFIYNIEIGIAGLNNYKFKPLVGYFTINPEVIF